MGHYDAWILVLIVPSSKDCIITDSEFDISSWQGYLADVLLKTVSGVSIFIFSKTSSKPSVISDLSILKPSNRAIRQTCRQPS